MTCVRACAAAVCCGEAAPRSAERARCMRAARACDVAGGCKHTGCGPARRSVALDSQDALHTPLTRSSSALLLRQLSAALYARVLRRPDRHARALPAAAAPRRRSRLAPLRRCAAPPREQPARAAACAHAARARVLHAHRRHAAPGACARRGRSSLLAPTTAIIAHTRRALARLGSALPHAQAAAPRFGACVCVTCTARVAAPRACVRFLWR
jgi:hypothetical protein